MFYVRLIDRKIIGGKKIRNLGQATELLEEAVLLHVALKSSSSDSLSVRLHTIGNQILYWKQQVLLVLG